MHIKFISRGKGSAKSAEEYLLQEHDHNGEIRADVQVLRGNPSHVSQLADSLDFKHRYTSGVIAWHKDDAPTDKQIAQVLDDFERVAFAGLEPNQYTYYAVLHEESNGAKHVHVITPRVELSTGKSMNVAPPNHQKTYDVLVDKYNTKHNWASPKDLHRRKLVNNRVQLHSDMSHTKAKTEINKAVQELIAKGTIKNENNVTKYLNSIDGVTVKPRRSKKNLSIELEGIKKPIRLEGLAYAKGFNVGELRQELRAEQESRARETTADRTREYERVSEVLEDIITDRARFNQGRYIGDAEERQQEQQDPSREQQGLQRKDNTELSVDESRTHKDKSQAMDNPNSHGLSNSPSPSVGNVGNNQVPIAPTPSYRRQKSRDSEVGSDSRERKEDTREVHNQNMGESPARSEERAERMARHRKRIMGNRLKPQGELNDAIRERIKSNLEDTRGTLQGRDTEHISKLREEFKGHKHSIQQADERSTGSDRTAEQDTREVSQSKSRHQYQYQRRASNGVRELVHEAKGRVGELTATVGRFVEKAIEKIKSLSPEAIKSKIIKELKEQSENRTRSQDREGRGIDR